MIPMGDMFMQSWWMPAVRGVIAIAFGALALLMPGLTLLGLVALFAAYSMLGGAAGLAAAWAHRKRHEDWWLPLLLGIAGIAAGIIALVHPGLSLLVLVLLIGANALVGGILDMAMAIRLRKTLGGEWLLVLSAVASIVFGVLVFLFPGAGALALVWMIGVYALATGVLLLALGFSLRSARTGTREVPAERRVLPDRRRAMPAH
jgi:uncharacterized membrane protein HdeD (DUF308 family)